MSDIIRTTLRNHLGAKETISVPVKELDESVVTVTLPKKTKVVKSADPLVEKAIALKEEKGSSFNPVPKPAGKKK